MERPKRKLYTHEYDRGVSDILPWNGRSQDMTIGILNSKVKTHASR